MLYRLYMYIELCGCLVILEVNCPSNLPSRGKTNYIVARKDFCLYYEGSQNARKIGNELQNIHLLDPTVTYCDCIILYLKISLQCHCRMKSTRWRARHRAVPRMPWSQSSPPEKPGRVAKHGRKHDRKHGWKMDGLCTSFTFTRN